MGTLSVGSWLLRGDDHPRLCTRKFEESKQKSGFRNCPIQSQDREATTAACPFLLHFFCNALGVQSNPVWRTPSVLILLVQSSCRLVGQPGQARAAHAARIYALRTCVGQRSGKSTGSSIRCP